MDKKTIFVAKAEKDIAALLEMMLSLEGYNVITVSDERGYDAFIAESLRRYEQEKDRVDLIINGFNVNGCLDHYPSFCRIKPDCKMIIYTASTIVIDEIKKNPRRYERIVDYVLMQSDGLETLRSKVRKALAS